jgi:ABC-2 type transport system permease protein
VALILAIARRDVRSIWLSAFGVGCGAAFVALAGVLLVIDLRADQAQLAQWFSPLFVVVALLASLLTVRSFAEEERTGSLELLLTMPVSRWQLVAGKVLGASAAVLVALAWTLVCPLLVAIEGHPDFGPILTGYVGLVLAGVAFVSLGTAVSAATGSFLVAAAGSAGVLMALWFGGLLATNLSGGLQTILGYLSPYDHVTGFLRGTLSISDAVYFLSLAVVGAMATRLVLEARR